jgi:hypothetical protein
MSFKGDISKNSRLFFFSLVWQYLRHFASKRGWGWSQFSIIAGFCYFYVTDGNIMYLTDASRFLISCVIQHYAPVVGWRNRCIMLIMSLYPSWRQTLRLPPPGIEPGSPASQAGTLPKELQRHLIPMLRIRDFYPGSRILIFSHPGSWIQNSNKREG